MIEVRCPLCQEMMEPKEVPAFKGIYRIFACPSCHGEFKQPLMIKPEPQTSSTEEGHSGCAECAFGDVHCTDCDDTLCPTHVRTVEKYANYFSEDLKKDLLTRYGGRIFCPLCFQATIKRFSTESLKKAPPKPKIFNWPLILGLLSIFVIIIIGLKRCDATSLINQVTDHDPPITTGQ